MAAGSASWILDDFADNLDTRETEDGIEIRHHNVLSRHRTVRAANYPSQVGSEESLLSAYVGAVQITKGTIAVIPYGGTGVRKKYVCVSDGYGPSETGVDYVLHRQVWELYTPWEAAPAAWNG